MCRRICWALLWTWTKFLHLSDISACFPFLPACCVECNVPYYPLPSRYRFRCLVPLRLSWVQVAKSNKLAGDIHRRVNRSLSWHGMRCWLVRNLKIVRTFLELICKIYHSPHTRIWSGRWELISFTTSPSGRHIFKDTTLPAAWTPLSVRAARIQWTCIH